MAVMNLKVNGRTHPVDVDPATPLLYVLSDDLGLRGPKFGCGLGQCGSCAVMVNGRVIRSCVTAVRSMAGSEITNLEGLGNLEKPHPTHKACRHEPHRQCRFCNNGLILNAKVILHRHPT